MTFAGSSSGGAPAKRGRFSEGLVAGLIFPGQLNCGQHACHFFWQEAKLPVSPQGWGPKLDTPSLSCRARRQGGLTVCKCNQP